MKILQVYDKREVWGGEDLVLEITTSILEQKGHCVYSWIRRNSDFLYRPFGKVRAFLSGIYSHSARHAMEGIIETLRPDVVHTHNLYPFISPSVLVACKQAGIPVVVHCHSYYLTCPATFHFRNGEICERCAPSHEYWCLLKNCRGKVLESAGYALRIAAAKKLRLFADNVTLLIALTQFAKSKLIRAGFSENQVVVLHNALHIPPASAEPANGQYVAYVGRLSPEKGVETLIAAARLLPEIEFQIAGDGPAKSQLLEKAPKNVVFLGWLQKAQLADFYRKARLTVIPSMWFEGFPMALVETMFYGKAVVCSHIGGLPEIMDEGKTGLTFEPGNPTDLSRKIRSLWNNRSLCREMGIAGRKKGIHEYGIDVYYKRLMEIYDKAILITKEFSNR